MGGSKLSRMVVWQLAALELLAVCSSLGRVDVSLGDLEKDISQLNDLFLEKEEKKEERLCRNLGWDDDNWPEPKSCKSKSDCNIVKHQNTEASVFDCDVKCMHNDVLSATNCHKGYNDDYCDAIRKFSVSNDKPNKGICVFVERSHLPETPQPAKVLQKARYLKRQNKAGAISNATYELQLAILRAGGTDGSCAIYGCSDKQNRQHECQCDGSCKSLGDCCGDYKDVCVEKKELECSQKMAEISALCTQFNENSDLCEKALKACVTGPDASHETKEMVNEIVGDTPPGDAPATKPAAGGFWQSIKNKVAAAKSKIGGFFQRN